MLAGLPQQYESEGIDRLHIDFISEDAARWNAFTSGDTHFVKVPVTQFDRVLESRIAAISADALDQAGYKVVVLDTTQATLVDGGLSCMSLRFSI